MHVRSAFVIATVLWAAPARADDIVACWRFNQNSGTTVIDSSGNELHGSLLGTPTPPSWVSAVHFNGLLFDDSLDYMQVEHNDLLNFTTAFTVSFFINASPNQQGSGAGVATILDKSHGVIDFTGWAVQAHSMEGDDISFALGTGSGFVEPRIPDVLDNTWHRVYIVVSLEPNLNVRCYRDDVLVTHFIDSATQFANNTRPLFLGAHWNGAPPLSRQFAGILEEVRVYDRALTLCELNELWNLVELDDCDGNWLDDECATDSDDDGYIDVCDNCPTVVNYEQRDCDGNGVGEACEPDSDGDGVVDPCDNCPMHSNVSQLDCDGNGVGDLCQLADCVGGDPACSDCNGNGQIDVCELRVASARLNKPAPTYWELFGGSVAISGSTIVVGASAFSSGSANVFLYSNGTAAHQATLSHFDIVSSDNFGYDVDISDNTAVVGAPHDDYSGTVNSGSVRVFVRNGLTWTQQSNIFPNDAASNDSFGYSVAIDGDTLLVGSPFDDNGGGNNAGAAYVFVRTNNTWSFQAKLVASAAAAGDQFGRTVELCGDTAIVSAVFEDVGTNSFVGAVYVFTREDAAWSQQSKLTNPTPRDWAFFGHSIALSGDTALVGTQDGFAVVFVRSGNVWIQQAQLYSLIATQASFFGMHVALDGDMAVISAPAYGEGAVYNLGAAYRWDRSASKWTQTARLLPYGIETNEDFGLAVAVSGTMAVVGAPEDNYLNLDDAGSAFVFDFAMNPDDCNGNLIIDECEVPSLVLLPQFITALLDGSPDCIADLSGDGNVDARDLKFFVDAVLAP